MLNRDTSFKFCIAPMMEWTDRHYRYFIRLISPHIRLYSEMLTADAVRFGDKDFLLSFDPKEHPIALQLGGSHPQNLAEAAVIGEAYGYDEINLNIGCPSDRVQSGRFGACLMKEPKLVAECVDSIRQKVNIEVSIKCRIGVDDQDSDIALFDLVQQSADVGCRVFIIHARKAWLKGLSPKENRDVPPLDYDLVYKLKQNYPDLTIIINGGINNLEAVETHLPFVDGVMIGRQAYKNPYMLSMVGQNFFDDKTLPLSREEVLEKLIPYAENMLHAGGKLHHLTKHLMGLYQGQSGGALWRRFLSEHATPADAKIDVLKYALAERNNRKDIIKV